MNVNTQIVLVHIRIVHARVRVAVALAWLALELLAFAIRLPFLLHESVATRLALIAARVVRTSTDKLVRCEWIRRLALLRVTVAHATTADRDITNTVEILKQLRIKIEF